MNFQVFPFANWLHRVSRRHSFSGEFTANALEWFCADMLLKAQSGVIPVAALETAKLEKNEVSLFLARELLFLRSVANGAKLSMLATLFDELQIALLDGANAKIEMERSIKKVS
ncbi:MAG: hypothetical protein ABL936_21670 [Aestuariivirga sp.]